MIIQCQSCSRRFVVKDENIPSKGRMVQCGYCSVTWVQKPSSASKNTIKLTKENEATQKKEGLSVDSIKASDGKTYKFLGSQWAQVLPSGKTGLFAKKKIGKELDRITGRKIENVTENKRKKIKKEVDPSSQEMGSERLPDIYRSNEGIGFFGFIFLMIVIGFSLVGLLKTFETDLINNFTEAEYLFEVLDQQLIYVSETFKNVITIINDLINSY